MIKFRLLRLKYKLRDLTVGRWQRAKKGYSSDDLWELRDYILRTVGNALQDFAVENTHSYPPEIMGEKMDLDKWNIRVAKLGEKMKTLYDEEYIATIFLKDDKPTEEDYTKQAEITSRRENEILIELKNIFPDLWI